MRRKGFTLIELIIVIVVFSILTTVLFRTYNTIMQLSIRSEFQKNIQTDVLFVNQLMHNLAEDYTIDYAEYGEKKIEENGMVDKLHLTSIKDKSKVTLSYGSEKEEGDCYEGNPEAFNIHVQDKKYDCGLYYQKNTEKETRITAPNTLVTNVGRQILPLKSNASILKENTKENIYNRIAYPGVVMYWRAYHRGYGFNKITNTSQVIQWFFTLTDKAQL